MADKETPSGSLDPDIFIPPGVAAAAAMAEAAHAAAYTPPEVASESNETVKLAETPVDPPEQPTPIEEEDFERKYKAMKGRHDQLANENRYMNSRLSNLEQTLATIAGPPVPQQQNGAADPTLDQITAEEISDYGEEFLQLVAKQAKKTLAPTIEELRKENQNLKQQLGQVGTHVVANEKDKLFNYLDSHLTTWKELNYNEDFLGWLAQPDPYSGASRHNLLKQAFDRNDSVRVLAFFNGFLADEAATAPRNHSATNGAGNGSSPPKVPLEKFAAPGRARTTAQAPVEKPVIRRDQIAAFYVQVANGAYADNLAEKQRLENMIFEAQREGRIT